VAADYAGPVHGLYAWLRRHPRLVDSGLAGLLLLMGGGLIRQGIGVLGVLLIPLLFGMVIPIVFRRAYPVGTFTVVIAVGAIVVALARRPAGPDAAVLVVLYTLAVYRPRRISIYGLVICLVGALTALARWHPTGRNFTLTNLGLEGALLCGSVLLAWALGDSIRWRRDYYQALEERATRLEREREALAQVAAAAERARIAREMHDVVAHNVSVMVVQADGAAYALDHSPAQAREAIGAISRTGRQALAEMRRLLGVLRAVQTPAELGPMPGIDDLGDLLEQTRASGIPVSYNIEGKPRPLPPGADLAAYRAVQESLTNVRKHAGPGVTATVSLEYGEDGLTIVVTDDGRGAAASSDGAGHGLAGMRERAELYGGTVLAGPRPGGGYQVTVRMPLTEAEQQRGAA
jgi:signal transduction histidine kinase